MQQPRSNGSALTNTSATQSITLCSSTINSTRTPAPSPQQRAAFNSYPTIRGVLPPLASSRNGSSCVIPPPANCSGHGTLSGCTCNCTSGYANDLSNLLAPQWCKATAGIIPDGRPGVSPIPAPGAPGAPPPAAGDAGTPNGTGGFMRTRMFWVLLVALLLLVLACGIWCFIRVRRRRARQRHKKKHKRSSKSRRRKSAGQRSSSDSSGVSSSDKGSSSSAADESSSSSSSSDGGSATSGKGKRGGGKPKAGGKHAPSGEDKPAPRRGSQAAAGKGSKKHSDARAGASSHALQSPQHQQRYASAPGRRRLAAAFAADDLEAAPPVGVRCHSYTGGARLPPITAADGRQRQQYGLGPRQPFPSAPAYARGGGGGGGSEDEPEDEPADLRQVQVVVDATGALAYQPPHSGGASPRSRQLALNASSSGGAPGASNWHRLSSGDPGLSARAQAAAEQRGRFAASTPGGSMRPPAATGAGSPRVAAHSSTGLRASDRQRALSMQQPVRQQQRRPPPGRHELQQPQQQSERDDGY